MKNFLLVISILILCVFSIDSAMAVPFTANLVNDIYDSTPDLIPTPGGDNNIDIYQAINRLLGTGYTANEFIDFRFVEPDYVWTQLDGDIAAIGMTAGSNSLGVYSDIGIGNVKTSLLGPHSGFTWLGDGTAANPYPAAAIPLGTGANFGWCDNARGYYSEPSLNSDGLDHMVTYDLSDLSGATIYIDKGSGPEMHTFTDDAFLIAWEDLNGLGDEDFDDYMVVVDKAASIPDPSAVFLLGSASLIGFAGFRRKSKK